MISDPELAVLDPSATVAGWFDEHAGAISGYVARRVGPVVAGDVLADTFRVAIERFDEFDPARGSSRAWLFGIASNLLRRHWRGEQRRLRAQAELVGRRTVALDPLLRVDDAVDARRRYESLVGAVIALPVEDRELLVLMVWEQMSSREAAEVLGVQPGTVRSRLHRIRIQLAEGVSDG